MNIALLKAITIFLGMLSAIVLFTFVILSIYALLIGSAILNFG